MGNSEVEKTSIDPKFILWKVYFEQNAHYIKSKLPKSNITQLIKIDFHENVMYRRAF